MAIELKANFFVENYRYFIFDFDGIVKDSVDEKRKSFSKLFSKYQSAIPLIEKHHLLNGGVSRYEKIPIYLEYCNIKPTDAVINLYLEKFSELVIKSVINSDWVPGFLSFYNQINDIENVFIVSATPEKEIKMISKEIGLNIPLSNIYGSPASKVENIGNFFKKHERKNYIFFGDSFSIRMPQLNMQ